MTPGDAAEAFAPHATLASRLLAELDPVHSDGSHDLSHIERVWRNALSIARAEPGCDTELLVAAVVLHDCVAVEKDSPDRSMASRLSAARAGEIMAGFGWSTPRICAVAHAIEAHSFSAGIAPETLEARVLQDADRLDAIGAIGIARCFYVAGRMGSVLYDLSDPAADQRPLDDHRFALDHFGAKLFRVADGFCTAQGRALAERRTRLMRGFVAALLEAVG